MSASLHHRMKMWKEDSTCRGKDNRKKMCHDDDCNEIVSEGICVIQQTM